MTDNRPSIAELQQAHVVAVDERADEVPWGNARDQILDAAPVLMEIAAAALALGPELVYLRGPLSERLRDALAKVTS